MRYINNYIHLFKVNTIYYIETIIMSIYHQVFFPFNQINTVNEIENLQKYMCTYEFTSKLQEEINKTETKDVVKPEYVTFDSEQKSETETETETETESESEQESEQEPEPILTKPEPIVTNEIKREEFIIPEQEDTLFWCIYIAVKGYSEYLDIQRQYRNIEVAEKQKMIDYFKHGQSKLKNMNKKVSKVMTQEIMSDLMTNNKTSLSSILALSCFYNKNIIVFKEGDNGQVGLYYNVFPTEGSSGTIIIKKLRKDEYGISLEDIDNTEKINKIQEIMFCVEDYEKPMKSISNYKVDELQKMGEKFGVDMTKKYKKQDLYVEICKLCVFQ